MLDGSCMQGCVIFPSDAPDVWSDYYQFYPKMDRVLLDIDFVSPLSVAFKQLDVVTVLHIHNIMASSH